MEKDQTKIDMNCQECIGIKSIYLWNLQIDFTYVIAKGGWIKYPEKAHAYFPVRKTNGEQYLVGFSHLDS